MKRLLATISGAIVCFSTVTSVTFASTSDNSDSSQSMVFVGQDVTQQDHYTYTFTRPLQNGGQQSEKVSAPAGSLFEIHETTLSDALANHELYVPVQGDSDQQRQEMQQLTGLLSRAEGITKLANVNPFATTNNATNATNTTAVSPSTITYGYAVESNFLCGSYNVYDDYTVYYGQDLAANMVYPTSCNEHLSAMPSTGWLDEDGFAFGIYNWANNAALSTSTNYNSLAIGNSYAGGPSGEDFDVYAKASDGNVFDGIVPISLDTTA